ncbi:MAG: hypothetical protein ACP5TV_01720 [Anaerolineae bacterium]
MKALIRPLGLMDLPALARLQSEGISLDPKRSLIQPQDPLRAALRAPLAFACPSAHTYVARKDTEPGQGMGFVQLRCRPYDWRLADVAFIAPALEHSPAAAELWTQLLTTVCLDAGQWGIERIFASLPAESQDAVPFLNAGFIIFAREDILVNQDPVPPAGSPPALRPQRDQDGWALQRLYGALLPMGVKQVEGAWSRSNNERTGGLEWEVAGAEGYVFEQAGELLGHVQIVRGKLGCWLELALHPETPAWAQMLVDASLLLLARGPRRPVYCPVRTYQEFLKPALLARGFVEFDRRELAVFSTLGRVYVPAAAHAARAEPRAEVSVTPMALPHA